MVLLKESLAIDFTVDPRMLTKKEKITIIEYIKEYKSKVEKEHLKKTSAR